MIAKLKAETQSCRSKAHQYLLTVKIFPGSTQTTNCIASVCWEWTPVCFFALHGSNGSSWRGFTVHVVHEEWRKLASLYPVAMVLEQILHYVLMITIHGDFNWKLQHVRTFGRWVAECDIAFSLQNDMRAAISYEHVTLGGHNTTGSNCATGSVLWSKIAVQLWTVANRDVAPSSNCISKG